MYKQIPLKQDNSDSVKQVILALVRMVQNK